MHGPQLAMGGRATAKNWQARAMTQDEETALHRRVRELEARVTELEVAAAFDRQTREALDEVVREFATRVEILERKLAELVGQVGGLEIGDEPPPE